MYFPLTNQASTFMHAAKQGGVALITRFIDMGIDINIRDDYSNTVIQKLPAEDAASYAIMQVMRDDEMAYADMAIEHGGRPLPPLAKKCMQGTADIMKAIAYYC
jgi:demethoxyubiquinone hydroxylase (CLK1/Coq7/Cat5 family)